MKVRHALQIKTNDINNTKTSRSARHHSGDRSIRRKAGARNSPDKPRAAVPFSFAGFFWARKRNRQNRIKGVEHPLKYVRLSDKSDLKGAEHLLCLPASRASLTTSPLTGQNLTGLRSIFIYRHF